MNDRLADRATGATGIRIAVDAMGGDHGPAEVVPGALDYARDNPADTVILVGRPEAIQAVAPTLPGNVSVVPAGQVVEIILESGPRVAIRDHGTGIAAEELPHIFERFHRAENPSRSKVEGTGLGLAIARWIADAHGAKISIESKPAEGSTFTVQFGG